MTVRARSRASVYAVLAIESCRRAGVDPRAWKAGSELQEMERFLLASDPRLLSEMEEELALDERRAVAKMVRRHG